MKVRYRCRECGRSHRAEDQGPVIDLRCCVIEADGYSVDHSRHDRLPDDAPRHE